MTSAIILVDQLELFSLLPGLNVTKSFFFWQCSKRVEFLSLNSSLGWSNVCEWRSLKLLWSRVGSKSHSETLGQPEKHVNDDHCDYS